MWTFSGNIMITQKTYYFFIYLNSIVWKKNMLSLVDILFDVSYSCSDTPCSTHVEIELFQLIQYVPLPALNDYT